MFLNDLIDKKIIALLDYIGETIDENNEEDLMFYEKLRDNAEKSGGLLYVIGGIPYLVIDFIGQEELLIIPVIKKSWISLLNIKGFPCGSLLATFNYIF